MFTKRGRPEIHPNDWFLEHVPDVLTYEHDTVCVPELQLRPFAVRCDPPALAVQPCMRQVAFRRRVETYPVLFWKPETVNYTFNGAEISAPVGDFTAPWVLSEILRMVKNLPPPPNHPVMTVAVDQIAGQTVLVLCNSALAFWSVAGWEEIA